MCPTRASIRGPVWLGEATIRRAGRFYRYHSIGLCFFGACIKIFRLVLARILSNILHVRLLVWVDPGPNGQRGREVVLVLRESGDGLVEVWVSHAKGQRVVCLYRRAVV